jgi:hypothetical protein
MAPVGGTASHAFGYQARGWIRQIAEMQQYGSPWRSRQNKTGPLSLQRLLSALFRVLSWFCPMMIKSSIFPLSSPGPADGGNLIVIRDWYF